MCLEHTAPARRAALLDEAMRDYRESGEMAHVRGSDHLTELLLAGGAEGRYLFTPGLVGALVATCETVRGKRSGYPHLCGGSHPCGKNDDPAVFLRMARAHAAGLPGAKPVSAAYSAPKAGFLIELVRGLGARPAGSPA